MTKTAVIIAAGMGSRLWQTTDKTPKTLLPIGNQTILLKILNNFKKAGIEKFIIVVGWEKQSIINYVNKFDFDVTFVENTLWDKGNGISVACVEEYLKEDSFILSMCDHIVSPEAIKRVINSKLTENILLVDAKIDEVFDIDDATKVLADENGNINNIGKEIKNYNCLDCGIFRFNKSYFSAFKQAIEQQQDSISNAVQRLIKANNMKVVKMQSNDFWLDIDTPEAYAHYKKLNGLG